LIDEVPLVRVGRVDAPEAGEELAGADLEARRERERGRIGLLELDAVETEDDVGVEL